MLQIALSSISSLDATHPFSHFSVVGLMTKSMPGFDCGLGAGFGLVGRGVGEFEQAQAVPPT
jgi:hypothetical protein